MEHETIQKKEKEECLLPANISATKNGYFRVKRHSKQGILFVFQDIDRSEKEIGCNQPPDPS